MKTLTNTGKTVKIEHTEQEYIKCVARFDMPEIGIKAGETFYLARSASSNDGTYYIVVWNNVTLKWDCPCPARKPCRHSKTITARHNSAVRSKQPLDIGSRGSLNGNRAFSLLKAS